MPTTLQRFDSVGDFVLTLHRHDQLGHDICTFSGTAAAERSISRSSSSWLAPAPAEALLHPCLGRVNYEMDTRLHGTRS